MRQAKDISKLYSYRDMLAGLVIANDNYAPIFLRVEDEIAAAEAYIAAKGTGDVLARARAIARQKAI